MPAAPSAGNAPNGSVQVRAQVSGGPSRLGVRKGVAHRRPVVGSDEVSRRCMRLVRGAGGELGELASHADRMVQDIADCPRLTRRGEFELVDPDLADDLELQLERTDQCIRPSTAS
jgi:hypothetical protein